MRYLFALLPFLTACSSAPTPDLQLRSTYKTERNAFLELKARLCATPNKRIVMLDPEWSEPRVTEKERAELYPLLKKIGAKGVYYDGDCSFRIPVWSVGFAGGGDYKGYSYRPTDYWRGKIIESSLDNINRESSEIAFFSVKVEDDWYLYFQHWP